MSPKIRAMPEPAAPSAAMTNFLNHLLAECGYDQRVPLSLVTPPVEFPVDRESRIAGGLMENAIRDGRVKTRIAYRPRRGVAS